MRAIAEDLSEKMKGSNNCESSFNVQKEAFAVSFKEYLSDELRRFGIQIEDFRIAEDTITSLLKTKKDGYMQIEYRFTGEPFNHARWNKNAEITIKVLKSRDDHTGTGNHHCSVAGIGIIARFMSYEADDYAPLKFEPVNFTWDEIA